MIRDRPYIELICEIISYVLLVSLRHLISFYQNSFILLKEKIRTLGENGGGAGGEGTDFCSVVTM